MSEFSIKFRGVRGSYPVANNDFLSYGGNTSCVEVNVGGHLIILDAGTGLIDLGNELMQKYIESGSTITERTPIKATLLLSHIHQDHILGIPFFKPMHLASTKLNLFGGVAQDEKLETELSKLLFTNDILTSKISFVIPSFVTLTISFSIFNQLLFFRIIFLFFFAIF